MYTYFTYLSRGKNSRPATFTVSLGGLFFAFPQQIFFVAVHLVLFFFGQALALFAGLVRGVDVGQAQQVVGGGAVELADGKQCVCLYKHHLRCKMLVGKSQTLELHSMDADLESPNEKVYGSNTLSAIGKQLFPAKKENSDD